MPSGRSYNFLLQSLAVFVFYLTKILSKIDHHQVLKANVGQDITMSCIFDENKIEQVSFMRQMTGDILSLGSELFLHQSHMKLKQLSSNRLDLILVSVNQNDSGLYTCMFNDEKLISFLIQVFVPPRYVSYFPLEGSISYPEGSSMNLSCSAFAVPSANITWIYKNKNKKSKNIHHGEDLYLSSIQPSDSGLYECIASNMYHATISRAFYVTVQYSPRVLILNKRVQHILHDTVLMKCRVCSMPQVNNIYWLRHNQQLIDTNIHIKTRMINDQCLESSMKIFSIRVHQFDQYECQSENSLGKNSDYVNLQRISRIHIDRNGRTVFLLNQSHYKEKTQVKIRTKPSNQILLSNSIGKIYSSYCWLFIYLIQLW